MYTFYTDKTEDFKCQLAIEGADLANVSARLLMKGDINLVFEGSVGEDGMCTIPVAKLRNILKEQTTGKAILEVIVDETYFKPWEDQYVVKASKKVTAEIITPTPIIEKKLEVKVQKQIEPNEFRQPIIRETFKSNVDNNLLNHSKSIANILKKKGITYENALTKKQLVGEIVGNYIKKSQLDIPLNKLLKETLEFIK